MYSKHVVTHKNMKHTCLVMSYRTIATTALVTLSGFSTCKQRINSIVLYCKQLRVISEWICKSFAVH